MTAQLRITLGQYSDKGRKETNQDFHGACIPGEPQLSAKGIAIALADGISSSAVSSVASQAAVKTFLEDYYCTSPAWSVRKSAQRVLMAINSWLHAQTSQSQYRYDKDRGYVCTLTAMVLKSTTAHVFHAGDARIYRLHGDSLEQLTHDHRLWLSNEKSYLSRALGVNAHLEIDYQAFALEEGDTFVLLTDGVYEFVAHRFIVEALRSSGDFDRAARQIAEEALARGSPDNVSVQIVRVDELPVHALQEVQQQLTDLPCAPLLTAGAVLDGYRIVRELHASARSHVYLAVDEDGSSPVVIKVPSIDLRGDPAYLERFMMEDWVAGRINSPHVLKAKGHRKRTCLYTVTEYIEGQTLRQWMFDNPAPSLESVRAIVEQIARGLSAFHRLEMLHQDLRPENVMIDRDGTVKIIDFGSTRVAGVVESANLHTSNLLGTAQYTAPEYFVGEAGTTHSDVFSLGVIAYEMLSARLPYGTEVSKARTRTAQRKLKYRSVLTDDRAIPAWIDGVLARATHVEPGKRYDEPSEFAHDLRNPPSELTRHKRVSLLDRNPHVFWKSVSLLLLVVVLVLLGWC